MLVDTSASGNEINDGLIVAKATSDSKRSEAINIAHINIAHINIAHINIAHISACYQGAPLERFLVDILTRRRFFLAGRLVFGPIFRELGVGRKRVFVSSTSTPPAAG